MARETLAAKGDRVRAIFMRLAREHPDARLALAFRSPFELLVKLILAAQCTDERVNRVGVLLFEKYRSPIDFARAAREEIEADVRPTGFYRNKAKALQAMSRALIERHGGEVPTSLDALLALPGVGRKTANILRGNAFGQPAIGVDTHVMRLAQRLGFSRHTDPDKIEADLSRIVRPADQIRFCHLLQRHGRLVCVARKPRCPECPIAALCPCPAKTPASPQRATTGDRPRPVWVRPRSAARSSRASRR
jgi:endonuclease-3